MKHDVIIPFGDASFTIRREWPDTYATPGSATVTVTDSAGNELVAATAATIIAATTINSDVLAGSNTLALAAVRGYVPGDRIEIAKSDDGPAEIRRVESYDTGTDVVTVYPRFNYNHEATATVSARFCTYALDASSATNFPVNEEGTFLWTPNTDDLPVQNTWVVRKAQWMPGDLEDRFRKRFRHYHTVMPEDSWSVWVEDAIDEIDALLEPFGKTFSTLTSIRAARRLLLSQIAYLVALGGGDEWAMERETMRQDVVDKFNQLKATAQWYDEDQDLVVDDPDEHFIQSLPLPRRFVNG